MGNPNAIDHWPDATIVASVPGKLTVGEFLCGILPRLAEDRAFPIWPPDSFALCLSVLKRTGAYAQVLAAWPPGLGDEGALDRWVTDARELGKKWRASWDKQTFTDLEREWDIVCDSFAIPLDSINTNEAILLALMKLVAVSDEASEGVGSQVDENSPDEDFALAYAQTRLEDAGTLCDEIDIARLRVLPRMHTPQTGLTDRSLGLNLSVCDPCEVNPQWLWGPAVQRDSFNLLLIPWPFEVLVRQFRGITDSASRLPDRFGFFTYDLAPNEDVVKLVRSLYEEAKRKVGRIDGVILPEMAVTIEQFRDLRKELPHDCFIVAGVGEGATSDRRATNEVRLSFPPLGEIAQKKHHPWKLNESQVIQYGLGGVLSPFDEWWEFAKTTDRCLSFVALSDDLVLTVLICEDLARPDPVANLVRAVGPNLVIALLMDGPQTKERWAFWHRR